MEASRPREYRWRFSAAVDEVNELLTMFRKQPYSRLVRSLAYASYNPITWPVLVGVGLAKQVAGLTVLERTESGKYIMIKR